jgi:hypothetical protein
MSDEVDLNEILIAPVATLIREMSKSLADAQLQLDTAALAAQNALPQELRELGYEPTWYQIPEAQIELKMAVHYERSQPSGPVRVWATPYNAKYRNALSYSADGSSTLTLRIVPVPPRAA